MKKIEFDVNIYALDQDPRRAAQYHNDRHVGKQILSTVQILTATHILEDTWPTASARVPSAATIVLPSSIVQHPCVRWCRAGSDNYRWLWYLLNDLIEEFGMRFKKTHPYAYFKSELFKRPLNLRVRPLSPWPQYLPPQFVRADPIEAYRLFYVHKKRHLAQWSRPSMMPMWWTELSKRENIRDEQTA